MKIVVIAILFGINLAIVTYGAKQTISFMDAMDIKNTSNIKFNEKIMNLSQRPLSK